MFGFEFVFWYWWALAVLLLGLEMLTPGFFFLWMAVSALVTGFLLLLVPMVSQEIQLFVFAVLSVSSVIYWKHYMNKHPQQTDHPLLNKRGAQYIGRTFVLIEPIENGRGKVKADDSIWRVEGEDSPKGAIVKVVAVDSTVFKVERVD